MYIAFFTVDTVKEWLELGSKPASSNILECGLRSDCCHLPFQCLVPDLSPLIMVTWLTQLMGPWQQVSTCVVPGTPSLEQIIKRVRATLLGLLVTQFAVSIGRHRTHSLNVKRSDSNHRYKWETKPMKS